MAYEAPNLRMWLMRQLERQDGIGALARAVKKDMAHGWKPSKLTPGVLRLRIERLQGGDEALSLVRQAVAEWEAHVSAGGT
jgi:hypothetical protein